MIRQNENLQGAEGMKRITVRIIPSLSDYQGNMELCQVEQVVIVGAVLCLPYGRRVYMHRCGSVWSVCWCVERRFSDVIGMISMRIEPSQVSSVLRDYRWASLRSTSPPAFTFRALLTAEFISLAQHEGTPRYNNRSACCSI